MVNHEVAVSQRRHRQFIHRGIPLLVVGLCLVGVFISFRWMFSPVPFRQTVVIVSDPVHVVSFDARNKKITTVDIPLDTVIPAALGYGKYSLRSLLSLDDIDHHNGALIAGSVSNALGLPVSGIIRQYPSIDGVMSIESLRRIFSFTSIIGAVKDGSHRSIPLAHWIRFVFSVRSMPVDSWHPINITQAIINETSADGSTVFVMDENKVDYILDTAFFDTGIRSEGTTVAVYNTTSVSSIGMRASRQLSRVGMQLIYVGNEKAEVKRCVVSGSDESLKTKAAMFIHAYYGCDMKKDESYGKQTGADLVVLLGTDFAKQYK